MSELYQSLSHDVFYAKFVRWRGAWSGTFIYNDWLL